MTPRQIREVDFYAEYRWPEEVCFDPVLGRESRPWNPNWFVYQFTMNRFQDHSQRLLDVGCGGGATTARFAKIGYEAHGIDIAPSNIAAAESVARRYVLEARTRFSVQAIESLNYPDGYFDAVTGIDVLHHVEVRDAVAECLRVLRPGGFAIFKEWKESPFLDGLRMLSSVRHFFPKGKSLRRHITADERKLSREDLLAIQELCPDLTILPFRVFARLSRLIPGGRIRAFLERTDQAAMRLVPALGRLGGAVVLVLDKRA